MSTPGTGEGENKTFQMHKENNILVVYNEIQVDLVKGT